MGHRAIIILGNGVCQVAQITFSSDHHIFVVALDVRDMAIGDQVLCLGLPSCCRSMTFRVVNPIPDYDLHRGCLGRPCSGITPLEAVSQRDRELPWIAVGLDLVRDLDGDHFFRDVPIADLNRVVDHFSPKPQAN
ncbi:MAG: hypothetical protein WC261_10255 [Synergistaceae bacterium]